jgi:hypothetical protein
MKPASLPNKYRGFSLRFVVFIPVLLFGLKLSGQAPISEVVDATLPKGAKLLTKEQLIAYTKSNYKRSQIPTDKKNTYQLDGLLISVWDLSVNPGLKRSLQASQSEMLGYLKRNTENTINYSKIITVNNIQFLVCEYQKQDEVYLWFKSDYNKANKNISGVIQFKKPDQNKAEAALQTFLASVHFKE